jgi:predicted nucleotidyltransferase
MKEQLLKFIEDKSPGATPLLLVIRGSHAYGTNVETSDTDYSGVFIQKIEDIIGFNYVEQINDDKNDTVIYEIQRFLQLLASNNPTVLELLNTPEDCILYKHPIFNEVLNNRDIFITKICAKSFGGYGKMQIQKAKGQNKKQNWEKDKVTRKDVLDFVYVIEGSKSIPWKVWNSGDNYERYVYFEEFCGVTNVPNARDVYAVYFDERAALCHCEVYNEEYRNKLKQELKEKGYPMGLGYKGLVKTGEGANIAESNSLRLSSIPKGETPICNIVYNKDGYSEHCKDFKSYEDWLANKNEARWVDVKSHGQKIDGKNMMHSKRLMSMAREIAEGKGINVRRDDAEYLISIRRGEIDLETLIAEVEKEIVEIDELFANSNLPDSVDKNFVNDLLIKIRKNIYNI